MSVWDVVDQQLLEDDGIEEKPGMEGEWPERKLWVNCGFSSLLAFSD